MRERLQKLISQAGVASRREAEKLILEGMVRVNGKVIHELGSKADPEKDRITVNGKALTNEKMVYILLYKPKGVVSTCKDPDGRKTVLALLTGIKERVYPVGRLDYYTEGLLILTNDGGLTHALTHPSQHVDKVYEAQVLGNPSDEKLDQLRAGITLEDGKTAPATIYRLDYDTARNISKIEITIHEGRNRQVRRMFEHIGHPVRNLKRTGFSFLTLQGLRRGQFRLLEEHEIKRLQNKK